MENDNEKMLTQKEVQRILAISADTLLRWRKSGTIPFYKIHRKVLFKKSDIDQALKKLKHG